MAPERLGRNMFFATHTNSNGVTTELEGESLQEISKMMAECDLDGIVRVVDETGFVCGWASAQHWWAV